MKLAAIKYDGRGGVLVDEVLAEVARVLKSNGVIVETSRCPIGAGAA